jgi:golgi SNAP receptor complex member 1
MSSRTSSLIKEKDHLINIDRLTRNTLENALDARERMNQQDKALKNSRGTMSGMLSRFSVLNSVMGNISLRRKRDAIIIGIVIAICIIILFFLWK